MAVFRKLSATLAIALVCLATAKESPAVAEVSSAAAPRRLWWWDRTNNSSGESSAVSGAGEGPRQSSSRTAPTVSPTAAAAAAAAKAEASAAAAAAAAEASAAAAAAAPAAELRRFGHLLGDGSAQKDDGLTSILAATKDAFYKQLSARKGQVNNAFVALLVGLVLLVDGERAFKWVLILGAFFVVAVGAKNEVTVAWDLDADDAIVTLVALEAGLAAAYAAWLGMEGIWIGLGIFLGGGIAHWLRTLLVNFGFVAFEENLNLVVGFDTVFVLAVVYVVVQKKYAKVISIISPFFGAALVSSALAFFCTRAVLQGSMDWLSKAFPETLSPVGGPWIDFLLLLCSNDGKDVGLFTETGNANVVINEPISVLHEPISRDRMSCLALMFVLFAIGAIIQLAAAKRSNAVASKASISGGLQKPLLTDAV